MPNSLPLPVILKLSSSDTHSLFGTKSTQVFICYIDTVQMHTMCTIHVLYMCSGFIIISWLRPFTTFMDYIILYKLIVSITLLQFTFFCCKNQQIMKRHCKIHDIGFVLEDILCHSPGLLQMQIMLPCIHVV